MRYGFSLVLAHSVAFSDRHGCAKVVRILDRDAHKHGALLRYTFIKMLTKSVYRNNLCHGISTLGVVYVRLVPKTNIIVYRLREKFLSRHITFSNLWIMCVCTPVDRINVRCYGGSVSYG